MKLIIITLSLLIVSIIALKINDDNFLSISIIAGFILVITIFALLIMTLMLCDAHIGLDLRLETYESMRAMLIYQYDNITEEYHKKPVYDEIMAYNYKIKAHRKWCDNKWIGIFYPNEIAELEYIEVSIN